MSYNGNDGGRGGPGGDQQRDRGGNSNKVQLNQYDFPPFCRVFIGNLATEKTTIPEIEKIFAKHGRLAEPPVLRRSFGFVQFDDPRAAAVAIERENGTMIGGLRIDVSLADNRPVRAKGEDDNGPPSAGRRGDRDRDRDRGPDRKRERSRERPGGGRPRGNDSGRDRDRDRDRNDRDHDRERDRDRSHGRGRDRYDTYGRDRDRSRDRDDRGRRDGPIRPPKDINDVFVVRVDNPSRAYCLYVEENISNANLLFEMREVEVDALPATLRVAAEQSMIKHILVVGSVHEKNETVTLGSRMPSGKVDEFKSEIPLREAMRMMTASASMLSMLDSGPPPGGDMRGLAPSDPRAQYSSYDYNRGLQPPQADFRGGPPPTDYRGGPPPDFRGPPPGDFRGGPPNDFRGPPISSSTSDYRGGAPGDYRGGAPLSEPRGPPVNTHVGHVGGHVPGIGGPAIGGPGTGAPIVGGMRGDPRVSRDFDPRAPHPQNPPMPGAPGIAGPLGPVPRDPRELDPRNTSLPNRLAGGPPMQQGNPSGNIEGLLANLIQQVQSSGGLQALSNEATRSQVLAALNQNPQLVQALVQKMPQGQQQQQQQQQQQVPQGIANQGPPTMGMPNAPSIPGMPHNQHASQMNMQNSHPMHNPPPQQMGGQPGPSAGPSGGSGGLDLNSLQDLLAATAPLLGQGGGQQKQAQQPQQQGYPQGQATQQQGYPQGQATQQQHHLQQPQVHQGSTPNNGSGYGGQQQGAPPPQQQQQAPGPVSAPSNADLLSFLTRGISSAGSAAGAVSGMVGGATGSGMVGGGGGYQQQTNQMQMNQGHAQGLSPMQHQQQQGPPMGGQAPLSSMGGEQGYGGSMPGQWGGSAPPGAQRFGR